MCPATQWKTASVGRMAESKQEPANGNNSEERDDDMPNRCEHLPSRWETCVCQELLNM